MSTLVLAVTVQTAAASQPTKPPAVTSIDKAKRPPVVAQDDARSTLILSPTDPGDPATILSYLEDRRQLFVRYPVHVAILTKQFAKLRVGATPLESRTLIAKHVVSELNQKFVLENGSKIFIFFLESVRAYPRPPTKVGSACQELLDLADAKNPKGGSYVYRSRVWADAVAKCEDLLNPKALNVIIYDAHHEDGDATSVAGRGNANKHNQYRSYFLLDYQRIYDDFQGLDTQEVVPHEAGHAFGLDHICDLTATDDNTTATGDRPPTNVMASANNISEVSDFETFAEEISYNCPASGGDRTRGFSPHQLMNILEISYHHSQNWLDAKPRLRWVR